MDKQQYSFEARFSQAIVQDGLTVIPNALFTYQNDLGLGAEEILLLCNLLSYRWTNEPVFPSLSTIVKKTGISRRTIQRIKARLVEKGYITVSQSFRNDWGQDRDRYDLDPLLKRLEELISQNLSAGKRGAKSICQNDIPPVTAEAPGPGDRIDTPPNDRTDTPKKDSFIKNSKKEKEPHTNPESAQARRVILPENGPPLNTTLFVCVQCEHVQHENSRCKSCGDYVLPIEKYSRLKPFSCPERIGGMSSIKDILKGSFPELITKT